MEMVECCVLGSNTFPVFVFEVRIDTGRALEVG